MSALALRGATIITPWSEVSDRTLIIEDGEIRAILPSLDIPGNARVIDLDGRYLAPGLIDLQVNGGGGVLFNDDPSVEAASKIAEAHRKFGTTSLLPTLISDTEAKMRLAHKAVNDAIAQHTLGILGLHLEGPYLNQIKKGIHPKEQFRKPQDSELDLITSPFAGSLMMTLAPETLSLEVIGRLKAAGLILAAGHSAATYKETKAALNQGVTGFTHLFNAMAPLGSRAPGPIAVALESEAWCSLIADGQHVDPAVLRMAIRAKKDGKMMFVSDAMPSVGTDTDHFSLCGQTIYVRNGRCVDEDGTLAGAHWTMIESIQYGVDSLSLSRVEAIRMATYEPARFLGVEARIGRIGIGAAAHLLCLDQQLQITGMLFPGADSGDLRQI